jgi:hypothetical protein
MCDMFFSSELEEDSISMSIGAQGAGLRMWICRALVELLGGGVGVESKGEGHGSTFFLELPLIKTSYDPLLHTEIRSVNVNAFGGFGDVVHDLLSAAHRTPLRLVSSDRLAILSLLVVDDVPSCR